jgi:PKD repeat protein
MERAIARRATPGDIARGGVTMSTRVRPLVSRAWATLVAVLGCLALVPVAAATPAPPIKRIGYAKIVHACPQPKAHRYSCDALVRVPVPSSDAGTPGVERFTFGDGALEFGPSGGLTPGDLASAYGYDPTATGSGQTVAIVDAFDDPNIESDLATFDSHYGLSECTKKDGCLTKVSQTGSTTSLPKADTNGWSIEISLDVETVHSVCPECKILLVEARNEESQNLAAAVNEAVALNATEVSNSYGGPEGFESSEAAAYNHPGTVITAATGDSGWDDWTDVFRTPDLPERPNAPASLPTVVAVGGTTLELSSEGHRRNETVWNGNGPVDESEFIEGATGGGCSTLFTAEPWQHDAPGFAASGCGAKRLAADVSAVGDPNTGFDIYDTYNCGESCEEFKRGEDWVTVGGTSLSTPIISSLYALAGGSSGVSYPSLTLYGHLASHSSLFDVTQGGNGFCGGASELECGHPDAFGALVEGFTLDVDCEYTTACNAAPGYDGPSGVGTPTGLGLFKPLAPTAAISAPSSLSANALAAFSGTASTDPYPGGSIAKYVWSWGDGSESSGAAPGHAYSAPGEYTVTLTVTDNYGLSSAPVTARVKVERSATELQEEAEAKKKAEEEAAKAALAAQEVAAYEARLALVVPDAQLIGSSLHVSATGAVKLEISCPQGESTCTGTVTLRTANAVIADTGRLARARAAVLTLASGSFSVPGGTSRTITLHLSAKARALLAKLQTLHVRATLVAHDSRGASHTTLASVVLHAPKTRHHKS